MDFVKLTLTSGTLFSAYLSSLLVDATANPPKSYDKYAQKSVQLVRGSSFRCDLLQNPYFRYFDALNEILDFQKTKYRQKNFVGKIFKL